jgi:uracil-DNA glycosylase
VICTLGNFATKLITESPTGITRCCGKPQARVVADLPVTIYPLLHPAAALRTPSVLARLREDFHRIPDLLGEQESRDEASDMGLAGATVGAGPSQLDLFGG